jgi:hypothetical protein
LKHGWIDISINIRKEEPTTEACMHAPFPTDLQAQPLDLPRNEREADQSARGRVESR